MTAYETELLCVGNALVDVFAQGDGETAARYGITRPVQHVEIETLKAFIAEQELAVTAVPGRAQKTRAEHRARSTSDHDTAGRRDNPPSVTIVSGGGAANTAKIAGLLGARVCFCGAVGAQKTRAEHQACSDENRGAARAGEAAAALYDEFGRVFEKDLLSAGVKLRLSARPSPTGICLMLKTEKETRIAASPSAALELSESDIPEEDIQKAGVVVIDGFILNRTALVRHVLCLADKYGKAIAIDLGSAAIAETHAAMLSGYARRREHPLIFFMNEAEAGAFYSGLEKEAPDSAGTGGAKNETVELPSSEKEQEKGTPRFRRACSFFQSFTAERQHLILVVKLGPRGALYFAGGTTRRAETPAVVPVETTGAGDAFSAAFLTAWTRNKSLAECAALGNKAARIILDAAGTQANARQFRCLAPLEKRGSNV